MKDRVLIVEDEKNIARVLQLELEFEGYTVDIAYTGTDGLIKYREQQWDLVLLDLMLPGLNGLDVLRRIRATEDETPVILLTAKNNTEDKVAGLDLGANDYVTKPFEIEELLARVRSAIRFTKSSTPVPVHDENVHIFQTLILNEQTREITNSGVSINLTPREYDLLLYMMKHPNQVLTREQLLDAVWGFDYYGDTNVVDVYIRYVRKKLEENELLSFIQTVRGVGYVLKEQKNEA
ncbi:MULTISPECIES: response regulator transcription factor [Psychrobacillus]|jgi:DNA-binding response OmpR family regulator|uniref:response regulator transcription factor n=1 Tax=Psychrobacillus TaxID=1221880 RepID=UPI0008E2D09E|nr:response regulator transcription factor [Psychrobacillus psychrodurans]MCZ8542271.1 response regulator transcription factor [Psychrobacillus psychrodurans]SFN20318.1 DNA-binding response regulator, OmpR family, contains REC and winged-helix (wHTH) domain [Psychrobacillus psychrodurans]